MTKMTGARFIAETFRGYGVTHVFFMPVIIPAAMMEIERVGIKRVMAHGEKAAVYMADGYARTARRAGVCLAQSVGAANLAAGLQDPYLGRFTRCSHHRPCGPIGLVPARVPGSRPYGPLQRGDQIQRPRQ